MELRSSAEFPVFVFVVYSGFFEAGDEVLLVVLLVWFYQLDCSTKNIVVIDVTVEHRFRVVVQVDYFFAGDMSQTSVFVDFI